MKKVILFLLTLVFCFSSCSEDDDSIGGSSDLIGKWQVESYSMPEDYEDCDYEGWIKFEKDNTYEEYDECFESMSSGTWTLNNSSFIVTPDEFPIPILLKIISLDSNSLTLEFPDFGDGIETVTYKKI